jgi:uracil-DNA glycosylase
MASDSPRDLFLQITESIHRYVESLRESGVTGLPCTAVAKGLGETEKSGHSKLSPIPRFPNSSRPPAQSNAAPAVAAQAGDLFLSPKVQAVHTLEELRAEIGDCRRCKLCQGRTHIVFGVGNPRAELVFVGEGPGRDEDLKGEPFVGRAGQLLTEIITKGMKMRIVTPNPTRSLPASRFW